MISNISIGLVSSNDELVRLFGTLKEPLYSGPLASGYFKSKGIRPEPIIYTYNPRVIKKDFELFVKDKIKGRDAFLLLVDREQEQLVSRLRDSAFCYIFNCDFSCSKNTKNFLYQITALIIKKFGIILNKMEDATSVNLINLPLKNFAGEELVELACICRNGCNVQDFSEQIDYKITLLKKRRRPIPRPGKSKEKDIKVEDNNGCYFEYGYEKHARFETGSPHLTSCYISGHYRFGKKIDESKHYNVTKKDSDNVSGNFLDCHGGGCMINSSENVSHINMFSNDFMEYSV
jgi:hypothetical protein